MGEYRFHVRRPCCRPQAQLEQTRSDLQDAQQRRGGGDLFAPMYAANHLSDWRMDLIVSACNAGCARLRFPAAPPSSPAERCAVDAPARAPRSRAHRRPELPGRRRGRMYARSCINSQISQATHKHSHSQTHALSLSLSHSRSVALSLSLSRMRAHAHASK
jgi:hypothetical protein